jgi:hypothetical protein
LKRFPVLTLSGCAIVIGICLADRPRAQQQQPAPPEANKYLFDGCQTRLGQEISANITAQARMLYLEDQLKKMAADLTGAKTELAKLKPPAETPAPAPAPGKALQIQPEPPSSETETKKK